VISHFTLLGAKAAYKYVDEIDTCSQFHQHFMRAFFADILLPKSLKVDCFSFVIFGAKTLAKMGT